MRKVLSVMMVLLGAFSLQAQPAGGFGGFQMPKIDVHCSEKFADIDYAGDGQVYHQLDIYLPRMQKASYPVVVHIYGSAWYSNSSKGMADLGTIVNALLDAGYAVVTPNHRSSADAKFPAQIEDIKGVIRFVRANAEKYRLDPSFIATSGFSSGGHLSSLAATSGGVKELEGTVGGNLQYSSRVNAACDWSGPVDLNYMSCGGEDTWNHAPEEAVMGFPFKGNEERFKALNATNYIDPEAPPVVIFHGTADNVVPSCQGPHFYELLDKAGIRTELYMVDGGGHGFNMYTEYTLRSMTNFLDKVRTEKGGTFVTGTNPVITGQFSADPSAHVFGDRLYLYPSHDIPTVKYQGDQPWFCMSDYHVFSTDDMTHWTDHGNIVDQKDVPWGNPTANSMWAPDCVEKGGKYYFYFPNAPARGRGFGFGIGVAVSDTPYGPFTIQENTVQGTGGIDPCAFKDDDGTIYLIWSGMGLRGGKLKDNMMEIDGASVRLDETFPKGQTEGPFLFKRNGKYYLTYPWVRLEGGTETLAYAMSDHPLGPYEFKGVFMEESPVGCWTNHHSFVEFKGQWYLFYHHNDFSPTFDKNRSVRIDKVSFREDGTIIPVTPTWRGTGHILASDEVHIDRYSECVGAKIDYLDEYNLFAGWKTRFTQPYDRVRFNEVDFGAKAPSKIVFRACSEAGATLLVTAGTVSAQVKIPSTAGWTLVEVPAKLKVTGMQDVGVELVSGAAEVDWISFR